MRWFWQKKRNVLTCLFGYHEITDVYIKGYFKIGRCNNCKKRFAKDYEEFYVRHFGHNGEPPWEQIGR